MFVKYLKIFFFKKFKKFKERINFSNFFELLNSYIFQINKVKLIPCKIYVNPSLVIY